MDPVSVLTNSTALVDLLTKLRAPQSAREAENSRAYIDRITRILRTIEQLKETGVIHRDPGLAEPVSRALLAVSAQLEKPTIRKPTRSKLEQIWSRKRERETAEIVKNLDDIASTLQIDITA